MNNIYKILEVCSNLTLSMSRMFNLNFDSSLFKTTICREFLRNVTDHSWLEDVERSADDLTLGKALVAVLTSCVNNPQNGKTSEL